MKTNHKYKYCVLVPTKELRQEIRRGDNWSIHEPVKDKEEKTEDWPVLDSREIGSSKSAT